MYNIQFTILVVYWNIVGQSKFLLFFQLFSCILPKNTKFCMSCNYMSLNVKEVIVYFVIITILTNQATLIHWRTSYSYINKSIFKTPTIYTSLATITNYFNVFHVTDDVNNVDLFSFYLWFSEKCQNQKTKKIKKYFEMYSYEVVIYYRKKESIQIIINFLSKRDLIKGFYSYWQFVIYFYRLFGLNYNFDIIKLFVIISLK